MILPRGVIVLLTGLLSLTSCFWGDEDEEENIVGNYWVRRGSGYDNYLFYINEQEFGPPLIPAQVVEAGHDERTIIIKSCSDYYIIPFKKIDYSQVVKGQYHNVHEEIRNNILGPFTKAEFHQNLAVLGEDSLMSFNQKLADCQ